MGRRATCDRSSGLGSDTGGGGESRGEAFAAWRRFFEALGEQRPTVLVFEDLHWADDGLLDFVDGLVDRATGVPLLVLCTARPELLVRRPDWGGGKANAVTLSLSALSDEDTARLIAGHLSQAVLPAEMQQTLLRRADGQPALRRGVHPDAEGSRPAPPRRRDVAARRDRGRRAGDGAGDHRRAARRARAGGEGALLQAASVVGKVFWLGSVAAIAGISAWEAEERLHALERKELVRRDRRASVAGETEYAVRHVLVRDVAYGQIPRARRADLHVRAAEWIESLGDDRAEDRAEMLAHHYLSALELTRAAGGDAAQLETPARLALREAGNRAYALSALESAASSYGKAIELWPRTIPPIRACCSSSASALLRGTQRGRRRAAGGGRPLARGGDIEGAAEAESKLAHRSWFTGVQQEARAHSQRSVRADRRSSRDAHDGRDPVLRLAASAPAGRAPVARGGAASPRRHGGARHDRGHPQRTNHARHEPALVHGGHGTAIDELESVLEDALRANSWVAARAYNNLATFSVAAGELSRSAEFTRAGVEVARRFTSRLELWLEAGLIQDDYYNGSWDRGIDAAEQFIEHPRCNRVHGLPASRHARGHGRRPRRSSGRDAHAAACIDQAREVGDPQVLQPSLGRCAWLALDAGDETRAARGSSTSSCARSRPTSPSSGPT